MLHFNHRSPIAPRGDYIKIHKAPGVQETKTQALGVIMAIHMLPSTVCCLLSQSTHQSPIGSTYTETITGLLYAWWRHLFCSSNLESTLGTP